MFFFHTLNVKQREKPHSRCGTKHKKWALLITCVLSIGKKTVSCLQPHSNCSWLLKDTLLLQGEIICTCVSVWLTVFVGGGGGMLWLAEQAKRSARVFSQGYSHLLWLSHLNMSNRLQCLDNTSSYEPDINLCLGPVGECICVYRPTSYQNKFCIMSYFTQNTD